MATWTIPIEELVGGLAKEVVKRLQARPVAPRLLSVEDAALYLGRTPGAVRQLIYRGVLPEVRLDEKVQLDVKDLDEFIEGNRFLDGRATRK